MDTWQSTLSLLKTHWETGVGLGRKAFARVYYTHMINSNVVPHSHNLYLQIISEFGILGLVVFGWLFVGIFRLGLKLSAAGSAGARSLNAGVMGALAGFLFHSLVDYFLWYYKLGILLWLLIAIVLVLEKLTAQQISSERNEQNA
ncbi:MAG: O-Antigen ligase [Pelotomaculum sp. PtaB.Bin117]|nr:MAG: O-Antigen ligase [Pelotomaculum sp. PtaB.Bin117]